MSYSILVGDVLEQLRTLPSDSVHCVVTSPPYWGLRDYGVVGQIGLEATPQEFIAKMVDVFREVRRVMRADATCWVNMGDSYSHGGCGSRDPEKWPKQSRNDHRVEHAKSDSGMKPKDLMGMPWKLAFALQDNGWWLRQDIIWSKPNPMPESVTDRCTKAHEYIFLLTKSARYYYDAEAIKERVTGDAHARGDGVNPKAEEKNSRFNVSRDHGHITRAKQNSSYSAAINELVGTRNKRSVWEIATEPFPEAHFATFPTKLVEPCILAGTSEKGCCEICGAQWVRQLETVKGKSWHNHENDLERGQRTESNEKKGANFYVNWTEPKTTGWEPSCSCSLLTEPCTVLDPFSGSGTTGLVALANRCNYIGVELNPEYAAMSERRLKAASAQEFMDFGTPTERLEEAQK